MHRRHSLYISLALGIFFVALSLSYYRKVAEQPEQHRSAICRWQQPLCALAQGKDIWQTHRYPNPPIMALILLPLAHLPFAVFAMAWFYIKCALTLLAVHWIFRMLEQDGRTFPLVGKVVAVLLSLRVLAGDLSHGNVNLFIFFLVMASLYAFWRRRDFSAGLALALGIACKVTPALFVPYFLWKRAWRCLAGCVAGLVLWLWLAPMLFLGVSDNGRFLQSWTELMIQPYLMDGQVTTEYPNQSLPGVLFRLASASPSFVLETDEGVTPLEYHNFWDCQPALLGWLVQACMAGFAILVMWSCRTSIANREGAVFLAECSIVLVGMLLFSERTWKHHCVTLLAPFSVLCYALFACQPGKGLRRLLVGSLVTAFVLMTSTSSGLFMGHERIGRLAQAYGGYLWANLVLLLALVIVIRRRLLDRPVAAAQPEKYAVLSFRQSIPANFDRSASPAVAHEPLCYIK